MLVLESPTVYELVVEINLIEMYMFTTKTQGFVGLKLKYVER